MRKGRKILGIALVGAMLVSAFGCGKNGANAPTKEEVKDHTLYPMAAESFVGDTMPYFDGGTYHIFYLADLRDGKVGYHPWALMDTEDFTSYEFFGEVIPYGESADTQDNALGTGSVIKDKSNVYHAFYTGHNDIRSPKEAIMHATSTDLKHWEKQPDDTFISDGTYSTDDFRDPYVLYMEDEDEYWMLIATRKDNMGVIAKYVSKDLKTWTDGGVFFKNDMGSDSNLECPTLLKYQGEWYLTFSDQWPDRVVHYRKTDDLTKGFEKPEKDSFDGNGFYAGRLETDGSRLFLVGWNGTKVDHLDGGDYEWGGNMVAHELVQEADKSLHVVLNSSIAKELNHPLDNNPQQYTESIERKDSSYRFSGKEYEMVRMQKLEGSYLIEADIADYNKDGLFGFAFNPDEEQVGNLNLVFDVKHGEINFYNTNQLYAQDPQTTVDFDFGDCEAIHVSLVISDGVAVMYVNDTVALTARMYMSQGTDWGFFSIESPVSFQNVSLSK